MCIRDRANTFPVTASPFPNELENITHNYDLPPLLPPAEKPVTTSQLNFNTEFYGKITHPVERILSEIPTTDGLNITKFLAFIKHLLQIKDLRQLKDDQILQVLLPKCRSPLKDRVLESLRYNHPVEELHTTCLLYTSRCV